MMNFRVLILMLFIGLATAACSSTKDSSISNTSTQIENRTQQGKKGRGRPTASQMITQMDANNDGKLAKSEVKGPLEDSFSTIDTNGDGFLSEAEIENAPKPERPQRGARN